MCSGTKISLVETCAPVQDNSLCEKEFLRVGLSFWTGPRPGDRDLVSTLDLHTAASVGDTDFILQMCEQVVGFSVFYWQINSKFRTPPWPWTAVTTRAGRR